MTGIVACVCVCVSHHDSRRYNHGRSGRRPHHRSLSLCICYCVFVLSRFSSPFLAPSLIPSPFCSRSFSSVGGHTVSVRDFTPTGTRNGQCLFQQPTIIKRNAWSIQAPRFPTRTKILHWDCVLLLLVSYRAE